MGPVRRIGGRLPSAAEINLARAAVEVGPVRSDELLYARVDMVPDSDGRPMILELELTEPSLLMATSPGSEKRFAAAIAARAGQEKRPGARPSAASPAPAGDRFS